MNFVLPLYFPRSADFFTPVFYPIFFPQRKSPVFRITPVLVTPTAPINYFNSLTHVPLSAARPPSSLPTLISSYCCASSSVNQGNFIRLSFVHELRSFIFSKILAYLSYGAGSVFGLTYRSQIYSYVTNLGASLARVGAIFHAK